MRYKKQLKRLSILFVTMSLLMNVVAGFHAWKFTHFDTAAISKTKDAAKLSRWEKLKTLAFGVNNPRPENKVLPSRQFTTLTLQSDKKIECWVMKAEKAKGTVVLFHGFSGAKSLMLDKADVLLNAGYNVVLADFMGSGGSEGNKTTLGFDEAAEVKCCYDYVLSTSETNCFLFGTSMGAVAIMKAIKDYKIQPSGIIIECPFGTMLETVEARFKTMHVPSFPMAELLVFWGGTLNGFNAFRHNPDEYAKAIEVPVLLLHGGKDDKVSQNEIDRIFMRLSGKKQLVIYPEAGHENYLVKYKDAWHNDVTNFMQDNSQ